MARFVSIMKKLIQALFYFSVGTFKNLRKLTLSNNGHVDVSSEGPPLAGLITCVTAPLVCCSLSSESEEDIYCINLNLMVYNITNI
jgi:hypothetical protein